MIRWTTPIPDILYHKIDIFVRFSDHHLTTRHYWTIQMPGIQIVTFFAFSVRGYLTSNPETRERLFDFSSEQETARELAQRKSNLILELRNYSENQKMSNDLSIAGVGISNLSRDSNRSMGIIPAQTQLSTALAINLGLDGQSVLKLKSCSYIISRKIRA